MKPNFYCPRLPALGLATILTLTGILQPLGAAPAPLLNDPVDISADFQNFANTLFLADKLVAFDATSATGKLSYQRSVLVTKHAFNNTLFGAKSVEQNEFPAIEYAANPELPFSVEFVTPRTIRLRATSGPQFYQPTDSLMLAGPVAKDASWQYGAVKGGHRYTSAAGSVTIIESPWSVEIRDARGALLTKSNHSDDNKTSFTPILPFSYVRRGSDYSRSFNAVFTLAPGEQIFGGGETFMGFDKRGQKVVLFTDDANGVQNETMYKPIPFFLSSRGYGMFIHTTTPITCDFGKTFSGINSLMIGDDEIDLFIFLGEPKDILDEYTKLTGKSPMPPLWSFGLWMSRCTYDNEKQVRDIAAKLRENKIPCDVLHLDTGWFETDWRCDYEFSKNRFTDPAKMIADLKNDGFHVSLWQLPYFVPKNTLFDEIVEKNLAVRDAKGNIPYEDAVLDFSNPAAIAWYQSKIAALLKLGVGAIKVDFGEAAPVNGLYASGRTGFYEHNYYPLRYNKVVAEITRQTTGEDIIWARSTWAGSQRYPLHWGGDAENTDQGMAAQLRGGLSLGLSGFTFWSHDAGGFVAAPSADLYRRWLAFGMLSSHSRCHGIGAREPWEYGDAFMDDFRRIVEMRYHLMPYIYAQAKDSSERGLPMVRALFVEFPNDPGSWRVDDEYLFGTDLLVAPLSHEGVNSRQVYLPPGNWIDYQSGQSYAGGWHKIEAGKIPVILLVRDGSVIPHIGLAQSTRQLDWSKLELVSFADKATSAKGFVCLPADNVLRQVALNKTGNALKLASDPLAGKVTWKLRAQSERAD
jgi:alpha-D-xyloside xylohydrolase